MVAVVPNGTSISPSPIVVQPSQDWDGNDGPWSSFVLQVGTPAQDVKVFISTAAAQTWVVVPQGCISSDPPNCASLRGWEFLLNQSSTWVPNLTNPTNIYALEFEDSLGYSGNGEYGFDDITLDGRETEDQTWITRHCNFSDFDNPIPSYMQNLRSKSMIPSTSWSYTAGNQYRLSQVLGSLILGGYDTSKFTSNNISWPFNEIDARDLTVVVSNITMIDASSESTSLLPASISAFLDSTVPQIWLPIESCALFEEAFNKTWDDTTELYLVSDAQHTALLAQDASVSFTIATSTDVALSKSVVITFPYAAFDLTVQFPIVPNATRYFPLKRAANETQYTLGRTFFQEAYITADYDRGTFSVSQCKWTAADQDIIAILPPSDDTNGTSTTGGASKSTQFHGLSPGAIAGIGLGVFLLLLVIVLPIFYYKVLKPFRAKAACGSVHAFDGGLFLKPELDAKATERDPIPEIDSNTKTIPELASDNLAVPEADSNLLIEADSSALQAAVSNTVPVYEMSAKEEDPAEIKGLCDPKELERTEMRRRVQLYDPPFSPA